MTSFRCRIIKNKQVNEQLIDAENTLVVKRGGGSGRNEYSFFLSVNKLNAF